MTRRRLLRFVLAGAVGCVSAVAWPASESSAQPSQTGSTTGPASRSPRVVWTEISLPGRESRPELERFLKHVIEQQTRRANWGPRREDPIEVRLEVTELTAVLSKDVVRVTCTGVGHLKGGQTVRSHFSMGGRPSGKAELERQLLTMLGRGIVGRLAEIARASHKG
jgi:hypothetical protein